MARFYWLHGSQGNSKDFLVQSRRLDCGFGFVGGIAYSLHKHESVVSDATKEDVVVGEAPVGYMYSRVPVCQDSCRVL